MDFDNRSVTLRWLPPADDGGRPITHYVIQKKDKFGGWFDALVTDDKNCTAKYGGEIQIMQFGFVFCILVSNCFLKAELIIVQCHVTRVKLLCVPLSF